MNIDDGERPPTALEPATPDVPDVPDAPDELTLARELVLRAHPDTVQELVAGSSLAELLASVPAAEAAYARVVAATRGAAVHSTTQATLAHETTVPGGGAVRSVSVNVDGLGPLAKIRAGISRP